MNKGQSQLINTILIISGGILLLIEISVDNKNVYMLIAGLVLLMLGLYRATNHWVYTKDDHKEENETDEKSS